MKRLSNNSYSFKDLTKSLFKSNSNDFCLPSKISDSLNNWDKLPLVRFCGDWILSVSINSVIAWQYGNAKKNVISHCFEYFLPSTGIRYHGNQVIISFDEKSGQALSCIIVGNDGVMRFWPNVLLPHGYIDQRIPNISVDVCLVVEQLDDNRFAFIFRSNRIIIADIADYSNVGVTFRQYSQPTGIFSGISRCFSLLTGGSSQISNFRNMKVGKSDDLELVLMIDNEIDVLNFDVLYNSNYKRNILRHDILKRCFIKDITLLSSFGVNDFNLEFVNFDLFGNVLYILTKIFSKDDFLHVLVTYNLRMEHVDSVSVLKIPIDEESEIRVVSETISNVDEPCLLAAIKTKHSVYILEVLTGDVKSHLSAVDCLKSPVAVNSANGILSWHLPKLLQDPDTILIALTATKQLITVKHALHGVGSRSVLQRSKMENDGESLFLDDSCNEMIGSLKRNLANNGDNESYAIRDSSKINSIALSTPKIKSDKEGDRMADNIYSGNGFDMNVSKMSQSALKMLPKESDTFGQFKKCIILYWRRYKNQSSRLFQSLLDREKSDDNVSVPVLCLRILREIIDEYPLRDARWQKVIGSQESQDTFCYSNNSLILSQQFKDKNEAIELLLQFLRENKVNLLNTATNVAPMTVVQCLFMEVKDSTVQLFGDLSVAWSLSSSICIGGELIAFVKMMNDVLSSYPNEEIGKIIRRCCQHVLEIQRKLSPLDILSQEVSLIPKFIDVCYDYLVEKKQNIDDIQQDDEFIDSTKELCRVVGKLVGACIRASLEYRRKFDSLFQSSVIRSNVTAGCWITDEQPIGIGDIVNRIIHFLVDFSRIFADGDILNSAYNTAFTFLDCYKFRINWMQQYSSNETGLRAIQDKFSEVRHAIIEKFVEDEGGLSHGLELAESFEDFYWLTTISDALDGYDVLEDKLILDKYLLKFKDLGYSEFVLDWYQDKLREMDQKNQGKTLAKIQKVLAKIQKLEDANISTRTETSMNSVVIGKFLDKSECLPTRWLHEIDTEDFGQAAATLSRLGQTEKDLLSRKKTLLSLSKLCCLAAGDELSDTASNLIMARDNTHLELVRFQEGVPANSVQNELGYSGDPAKQPVLPIHQLVNLYITDVEQKNETSVSYFVKALHLVNFSSNNCGICKISESDCEKLLVNIWARAVLMDDWALAKDDNGLGTMVGRVFLLALQKDLPVDALVPRMDVLFSHGGLEEYSANEGIRYLINRTFDVLIRDAKSSDFASNSRMICD